MDGYPFFRLANHCLDLMFVTAPLWIPALLAAIHCRSMRHPTRFHFLPPPEGCVLLPPERRLTTAEAIAAAHRASLRAATHTSYRLRRRLPSLATYAIVAPMLGGLLLLIQFIHAGILLATSHRHYVLLFLVIEALQPLLQTLPAGLAAFFIHRHLQNRAQQMHLEMQCAAADIANSLTLHTGVSNPRTTSSNEVS